jgi:hypothetical protein
MFAQQTAALSQNACVAGPSAGSPNMRNLWRMASIILIASFVAVNSDPKVDASTEFCLLLNQMVGTLLQNNKMPVLDRLSVACMICIDKTTCCHAIASGRRHVPWDRFTCVPVELRVVTLLEAVLIDVRMPWVKRQFPFRMLLQTTKHMKHLLKMSDSGHSMVAGKQRRL